MHVIRLHGNLSYKITWQQKLQISAVCLNLDIDLNAVYYWQFLCKLDNRKQQKTLSFW